MKHEDHYLSRVIFKYGKGKLAQMILSNETQIPPLLISTSKTHNNVENMLQSSTLS